MKVHLKKVNRTCIPIWVVTLVIEKKKKKSGFYKDQTIKILVKVFQGSEKWVLRPLLFRISLATPIPHGVTPIFGREGVSFQVLISERDQRVSPKGNAELWREWEALHYKVLHLRPSQKCSVLTIRKL